MSKQQYSCEICGQSFDSNDELQAHNNEMHPGRSSGAGGYSAASNPSDTPQQSRDKSNATDDSD